MASKIQVSNLSLTTTDDTLNNAFNQFGAIMDAIVMRDRDGRSRGFGFVTFLTPADATAAITIMDDTELDGRRIRVKLANERPPATTAQSE